MENQEEKKEERICIWFNNSGYCSLAGRQSDCEGLEKKCLEREILEKRDAVRKKLGLPAEETFIAKKK